MKYQIMHLNGAVLSEAEIPDNTPRSLAARAALEALAHGLDGARLIGQRPVLQIGPIGSRSDFLLAFITDKGLRLQAGCFFGSRAEFEAKLDDKHGDNEHAREYRAALVMIDAHAAVWAPDTGTLR